MFGAASVFILNVGEGDGLDVIVATMAALNYCQWLLVLGKGSLLVYLGGYLAGVAIAFLILASVGVAPWDNVMIPVLTAIFALPMFREIRRRRRGPVVQSTA